MLSRTLRALASLKVAIPLIVLLALATIAGSLFPEPDLFRSWWYQGLLGLLGLSLLLITILHVPHLARRRGRNAMIGVLATHAGILVLIAGAIYGNLAGERYAVRAVEQEMTVVPGLPFVIRLEELMIEAYPPETWAHVRPDMVPLKRQDSRIALYRSGQPWIEAVAAPGLPIRAGGFTLLPSLADFGEVFELIVTDPLGREKTHLIRPWAPPLVDAGEVRVMAHATPGGDLVSAQLFTMEDGELKPLGTVGAGADFEVNGHSFRFGAVKHWTGLAVYNRPHAPLLVAGCLLMFLGLVWHFYFRHRDSSGERTA